MNEAYTTGRLGRYTYIITKKPQNKIQAVIYLNEQMMSKKVMFTQDGVQQWIRHTILTMEGIRP